MFEAKQHINTVVAITLVAFSAGSVGLK